MDVLVVALLLVPAPDRRARSLDDYDFTAFFQGFAPREKFVLRLSSIGYGIR
jgi:hypothetical protein